MEAPINIVVESPDADKANLVGQAIAQGLKDNFGFKEVMHAHIVTDTPGFRAWTATNELKTEESLLDAMKANNPRFFESPVTVVSREQPLDSDGDDCDPSALISGIGEEGITMAEAALLDAVDTIPPMEMQRVMPNPQKLQELQTAHKPNEGFTVEHVGQIFANIPGVKVFRP